MNKELQCNIVNDLLPLYMDDLTSEETNSFIKKHLEECQNCQNEYRTFKAELSNSANRNNCLLYTSPSPRDKRQSRMPSSA